MSGIGLHRTVRPSPRGDRFDALLLNEKIRCAYYGTQCNHCSLPTLEMVEPAVNQAMLRESIERLPQPSRDSVRQANLFGTGSVLSSWEISDATFTFALDTLRSGFPALECLGADTRPEIALSEPGLARIRGALRLIQPVRFELVIGYETQDPKLRRSETGLHKCIREDHMQRIFALSRGLRLGLQINVMLMPVPTMGLSEAVEEAVRTIEHLARMQREFGIPLLVNLNPLYINRRMLERFGPDILRRPLPGLNEIKAVLGRTTGLLPIFVGLDDDGLALKKEY